MPAVTNVRATLYSQAKQWDEKGIQTFPEVYPFTRILEEVLFHGDLRYRDYRHFEEDDGLFVARLDGWLRNARNDADKKLLLHLARRLTFVDRAQMRSLYRDAYRRVITPWLLSESATSDMFFADDYEERLTAAMRSTLLLSVTTSFDFAEFLSVNSLPGLKKPVVLTEIPKRAKVFIEEFAPTTPRIILLEDFIGSGGQAARILRLVCKHFAESQLLCVPLIILQKGLEALQKDEQLKRFAIQPVFTVPRRDCLYREAGEEERPEFGTIRAFVLRTSSRVIQRLNEHDDPPDNAFGFNGSGAMIITAHNAPNNTLPLFHHRAPRWKALFRRLHHSY